MSDCRKCADFDWCVENEDCGLFKPKTQTNADHIRQMSDEEMAEHLYRWNNSPIHASRERWLDWLKSPADKEEQT